jgi:NTE family protein
VVAELADVRLLAARHRRPRIGLVLGSGAARGWAHIGVIRALERAGVRADIVCGTSVGALVGAAYASGDFERFCDGASGMRRGDVISFMDVGLSGGLLKGERFMAFVSRVCEDRPIEDLAIPFAAVATSLENGAEVWLRSGSTLSAIRASLAMPGLFTPVRSTDGTLVDGALVNPVPVSLARAMGADVVIAVDLSAGIVGRAPPRPPSMLNVVATSLDIMQVRITRSRMAGEPPDVIVAPRLAGVGLLDFHRADEAIREGERAMTAALSSLAVLGIETATP